MSTVAVIDVGSNTIKTLVARRGTDGRVLPLFERTLETRISQGITGKPPRLHPERIEAGIAAVATLHRDWLHYGPINAAAIVATSAVRDAVNGHVFLDGVEAEVGLRPLILTGDEEARFIAQGIRQDPGLPRDLPHFSLADLGGGSLEIIRFVNGVVDKALSLQLGSVRLFEAFPPAPDGRYPASMLAEIAAYVRQTILDHDIAPLAPLVGTGGGLTVTRALLAARQGKSFAAQEPIITREEFQALTDELAGQSFAERLEATNLPPGRADIYPVALTIYTTLLDLAGTDHVRHSLCNLRYGLADQLLLHGRVR